VPSPGCRRRATRPAALAPAILALVAAVSSPLAAQVPSPDTHFGFRMGADRQLAPAEAIEQYFALVASLSDRVELVDIGPTTEGHPTPAAIVSAPENIRSLGEIRAVNQRLADPRTLPPDDARRLAATHKAVLAIGAGIHASEVGATQAANQLLYSLATSTDPATLSVLQNVVVILIPSLNPDGHRLVVDWYRRQLGTPFEGGAMPWLYHKYAGHDVNRDGFMMNLAENRNLARFFYTQWHPQVFLTMHQMGPDGPRFFVPPNADPIDANYDPLIWRTAALLGSAMALELQRQGKTGVLSNGMFDYYLPGYEDSAPLGHNVVCLLTEVASVKIATPISVKPEDLQAGQKGLVEYKRQINFPDPWPGGAWTLGDIVDYNLTAVTGLLQAVSAYRETIVQNFYDMGRRAIEAGQRGGPFAFVIPPAQHDPHAVAKLQELLILGGVEVHRALEPFRADGDPYPEGSHIILLSQPYRAYVKTLFERQRYPGVPQPATDQSEHPYDATGWTLPDQMGIDVRTVERAFEPPAMSRVTRAAVQPAAVWGEPRPGFYIVDARGNGGAIAANRLIAAGARPSWSTAPLEIGGYRYETGSLVVAHSRQTEAAIPRIAADLGLRANGVRGKPPATARPLGHARVALYKPWLASMDEGWTRWVLEKHEFRFATLTAADVRAGGLRARYDVIILPSAPADVLRAGDPAEAMPPEYTGGLGEAGLDALKTFVEAGGTLVCLDQAGQLAIETFALPLRDVAREAGTRFFCPGSILQLDVDPSSPLAYGMPAQTAGFFSFSSAYAPTSIGGSGADPSGPPPHTAVRYASRDLLLSGWLEGEEVIAGRAAVVDVRVGTGRVVLLGFRVQHRAQSLATFRLLFNAILVR
jgi:hypothetical protein